MLRGDVLSQCFMDYSRIAYWIYWGAGGVKGLVLIAYNNAIGLLCSWANVAACASAHINKISRHRIHAIAYAQSSCIDRKSVV